MRELAREWYRIFQREVRPARWADPLREAALKRRLGQWTQHLTGVVIATCKTMGWTAVGRGHLAEVLPITRQEYLALDVMAFPGNTPRPWPRPVAVFELENQEREDVVAYALWKVSLVRCPLKGVFCYRRQPEEIGGLLKALASEVMAGADLEGRDQEAILVVVGTRSRAEDFPDGFFRPYLWDGNLRQFRSLL